jgi:hypothetical protein
MLLQFDRRLGRTAEEVWTASEKAAPKKAYDSASSTTPFWPTLSTINGLTGSDNE